MGLDLLFSLFSQVEFSQVISTSAARGAVEKWLLQVQDVMLMSIRDVIEQSKDVCSFPPSTSPSLSLPLTLVLHPAGVRDSPKTELGKGVAWSGGPLCFSDLLDVRGA